MEGAEIIVVAEPSFDVIVNREGGVMVVIAARPGHAKNPFLVHNGWRTIALFRDDSEIINLSGMPLGARKAIRGAKEIIVAEMDEESRPVRQYKAKVIRDLKLKSKLKREKSRLY